MKIRSIISKTKKETIYRERVGKIFIQTSSPTTVHIWLGNGKEVFEDLGHINVFAIDTIELDDATKK